MLHRRSHRPHYRENATNQVLEARSSSSRHTGFWFWLAPLLIGAVCLLVFTVRLYRPHRTEGADRDEAARVAMTFVKSKFGLGTVLRFAPLNSSNVQQEGNGYVVNGWVEAIRRDGMAATTYDYTCDLSHDPGAEWHLSKLFLQPQ